MGAIPMEILFARQYFQGSLTKIVEDIVLFKFSNKKFQHEYLLLSMSFLTSH